MHWEELTGTAVNPELCWWLSLHLQSWPLFLLCQADPPSSSSNSAYLIVNRAGQLTFNSIPQKHQSASILSWQAEPPGLTLSVSGENRSPINKTNLSSSLPPPPLPLPFSSYSWSNLFTHYAFVFPFGIVLLAGIAFRRHGTNTVKWN